MLMEFVARFKLARFKSAIFPLSHQMVCFPFEGLAAEAALNKQTPRCRCWQFPGIVYAPVQSLDHSRVLAAVRRGRPLRFGWRRSPISITM